VWATTPSNSRSELVMEPEGLESETKVSCMEVGNG
jgi:hypothetical protein